jgi:hypothetical protein
MRCAICHHAILPSAEPVVSTTMGELVHISCADCDALAAYRLRTYRAVVSTALVLGLLGLAAYAQIGVIPFLALLAMLTVAHVRLNGHWWRVTMHIFWWRARAGAR